MISKTAIKVIVALALAAGVIAFGFWVGGRIYDNGVADENARWIQLQADADRAAHANEQEGTRTSERVADTTREQAETVEREIATETDASLARIEYVYVQEPAPKCPADGTARDVPAGVLQELDQAVAAVAAAKG